MGDGEYKVWGETITVRDGRTSNERGSIAGSVITMLDAVRDVSSFGLVETDVARMAAHNPARFSVLITFAARSRKGSVQTL